MKTVKILILSFGTIVAVTACGKQDQVQEITSKKEAFSTEEQTMESTTEYETETEERTDEVTEKVTENQESETIREDEFSYSRMKNLEFSFLSGAGGWSTELYIKEDGSFHGIYHDSEMGDVGEQNPNGTMVYCEFRGKFGALTKVNERTYKTTIDSLSYTHKPGTKEIIDGVRYEYSEVYGLEKAEDIIFYLPGTKTKDLPEEYLSWVRDALYDYKTEKAAKKLDFIGLYNEKQGEGFSSCTLASYMENEIQWVEDEAKELNKKLQNDTMSQMEMNQTSGQIYELWDGLLNRQWKRLKEMLPESEMNALKKEQKKWIRKKGKKLKKIEKENGGGTITPLEQNLAAAEMTEKRVRKLLKYFK